MKTAGVATAIMTSLQAFGTLNKVLIEGDTAQLHKLLQEDSLHVKSVLNSLVTYTSKSDCHSLMFELPLALGACSGNPDTLTAILRIIDDVTQQDRTGNNIVHCLVVLADKHPLMACNMYMTLMETQSDGIIKQKLLFTENLQKFTPLSLAAELCVPEMMECILNTDAVYRFDSDLIGPYKQVMYKFKSQDILITVLRHVTYVPNKKLQRFADTKLLDKAPLTELRKKLKQKYFRIFILWSIWIVGLFTSFFFYTKEYVITGEVPTPLYSAVLAAVMFINFIDSFCKLWWCRQDFKKFYHNVFFGDRPFLVSSGFRFAQLPLSFLGIVITIMDLFQPSCEDYVKLRHSLHAFANYGMMMAMLSILQGFPKTSVLLVVIQKMMSETCVFVTVALLPYLGFSLVFSILETPFTCTDGIVSSNGTAFDDATITRGLYSTLMRLLNVQGPNDIFFRDSNVPSLSMFMYVMAILMWPMVLLNLLIALYNDKMQEITKYKDVITVVQNIDAMLFVHDSYYVPFMKLKQMLCKTRVSPMNSQEIIYVMEETAGKGTQKS